MHAMSRVAVIPRPVAVTAAAGALPVTADTALLADRDSGAAARLLAVWLPAVGGQPRRASTLRSPAAPDSITLTTDTTRTDLHDEGYALTVTPRHAVVTGASPRGVLWGAQTLRQLLPAPAQPDAGAGESHAPAALPVVDIVDHPRFAWRGLHLDVARHFFPVPFIEQLIDLMSLYKYNTLHWHLTDDQGWRIEIRSRPRLTDIGSRRAATPLPHDRTRSDGVPCAGHYTQAEVRRVVAYAAARGVTVVPEIEMPGHAQAALVSYPELGCAGAGYEVATTWGIKATCCAPGGTPRSRSWSRCWTRSWSCSPARSSTSAATSARSRRGAPVTTASSALPRAARRRG